MIGKNSFFTFGFPVLRLSTFREVKKMHSGPKFCSSSFYVLNSSKSKSITLLILGINTKYIFIEIHTYEIFRGLFIERKMLSLFIVRIL